jgi:hypothetical protein
MRDAGLAEKVLVPEDGEEIELTRAGARHAPPRPGETRRPGIQKWMTAPFSGA